MFARNIAASSLALLLGFCSPNLAGIKWACGVFPAPDYSSKDTAKTIEWFEGTKNAPGYAVKYDRLCG